MNRLEQAREILASNFVANLHDDFLYDVAYRRMAGERNVIAAHYLPRFQEARLNLVVAAIYMEDLFVPHMALDMALSIIGALHAEIEEGGGQLALCTGFEEIQAANDQGRVAILLSLEGAEPLGHNEYLLEIFHRLGVRLMGPTWARRNEMADCNPLSADGELTDGGFTPFGRKMLAKCARLGIVLDASHLSDRGFDEMAAHPGVTLIASHSNARGVYDIPRNAPDHQLRIIGERGGVIGLNAVNTLVGACDEDGIDRMLAHADHIISIAGEDALCLGLDFFQEVHTFSPAVASPRPLRDVIKGYPDLENFAAALLAHGYTEERVRKIVGGNAWAFLKKYLG